MKTFDLEIELLEDAVFSERTATEGGHRGLDYVPGGALLGAVAGRLYRHLSRADAYTLFHSGAVRFGNARPMTDDGSPAYPVASSWHHKKGETVVEHGCLVSDRVFNLSHAATTVEDIGGQPQQLRSGYVTADGRVAQPRLSLRMKTAIAPETARADEGALFGYDAVPAGTRLRARIGVDDEVPDTLVERLRTALQGELLLGRSRSAEYGRARTRLSETAPETPRAGGKRIVLWLLSDLAPLDDHGNPTLTPLPQWLGLPEGKLDLAESFLRSRRYSPWNAHRGGPDLERQVLAQGSVLVFDLAAPLQDEHLATLAGGLGAHRESGLGEVWLNPPLLDERHPAFDERVEMAPRPAPTAAPQDSTLIAWLQARHDHAGAGPEEKRKAFELAREYRDKVLVTTRRLKGLDNRVPVGPSASQWGSVTAAAKGRGDLARALFDARDGVCKTKAPGWGDEYWDAEHGPRPIADWARQVLGKPPSPRLARHLAREIQDILKQEDRP